jgi:phenylacetate-CoA ligase
MSDRAPEPEVARREWLATIRRHQANPARPSGERYWAETLERASRDEIRSLQEEKLRTALRYVDACVPFYRRKFERLGLRPEDVRGLDDLARIPVTTKQEMADDLAEHPPWGTYTAVDDARWLEAGWQIFASSGTTAEPRAFRYTAFDREIWSWADARAMWAMGFRPGRDAAMIAFGYGPHVWLWGVHYAFDRMGIPIVTAGGLDSRTRARFVVRYRPTILCCTPSYALFLASVLREQGVDPRETSVRALFCAGEPGFSVPATRRAIEEAWGADLHEFYGCTEAAPCAGGFTCAEVVARKDGPVSTHLFEDGQIWETVDPDRLAPTARGERGLSVVTNLCSEASPQIRFLVGDYTTLTDDVCECGRTHVRALGGFRGRADDMLNVRGVTLFPTSIEDAVRGVTEAGPEFEIVLTTERDLDVLAVRVESLEGAAASAHDALRARVESAIVAACELHPVVEIVPHGALPRHEFKAKRVRDLRGV